MFNYEKCAVEGCAKSRLTVEETCYEHIQDSASFNNRIAKDLENNAEFIDLDISGASIKNITLKKKRFHSCKFSDMTLENVKFVDCYFRQCFFDFSDFTNCEIINSTIKFTCFAVSVFKDSKINLSDITHSNFNKIKGVNFFITGADLYFSTFTGADMNNMIFDDCNLKKANFFFSSRKHVVFKSSNTEDAFFEKWDKADTI
jgi:uncharacterized protein YjbI with pentapeptide repeats